MDISIVELLITYQLPAIFFGAIFFGETVIITAAFLAGQEVWSISSVFWLSLFGTLLSDTLWFFCGQTIFKMAHKWERYKNTYDTMLRNVEKLTGKKPFLSLLFIKFLYGTRILNIVYLSIRKIPFSTFLLFDTLGTIIWLAVLLPIGWYAGQQLADVTDIVRKTSYALTTLVVLILANKFVSVWLGKKVTKK